METGQVNPTMKLENQGITGLGYVYYNLIEMAMGAEVNGNLVHTADKSVVKMKTKESTGTDNS